MAWRLPGFRRSREEAWWGAKGWGPDRLWWILCLPAFVKFSWAAFAVLSAGFKLWLLTAVAVWRICRRFSRKRDTVNCWFVGNLFHFVLESWRGKALNYFSTWYIGNRAYYGVENWDQASYLGPCFHDAAHCDFMALCCGIFDLSRHDFYVVLSVHNKWIIVPAFFCFGNIGKVPKNSI